MKEITLTQGKVALVDDEDYEWAMQWKWYAHRNRAKVGDTWYASRSSGYVNGRQTTILLHREIAERAEIPWSPRFDHHDGDTLNNQRHNIRPCTQGQNMANSRKSSQKSSFLKGVSFSRTLAKWRACITINARRIHLGYYPTEQAAGEAYNSAAIRHFGEFAKLNAPVATAPHPFSELPAVPVGSKNLAKMADFKPFFSPLLHA